MAVSSTRRGGGCEVRRDPERRRRGPRDRGGRRGLELWERLRGESRSGGGGDAFVRRGPRWQRVGHPFPRRGGGDPVRASREDGDERGGREDQGRDRSDL